MVLLDWPPPDHLGIGRKSCQFLPAQAKEEERRERYIGGVTALYDRRRDIAPVAMTATLEPGTREKHLRSRRFPARRRGGRLAARGAQCMFLKLKTGMWKSTRQRLKARITTAVRQVLKSKRLAHHSIQIPSSNYYTRGAMHWR
jgi:hypothetical protein